MLRLSHRHFLAVALVVSFVCAVPATAQVPIPLQEQVELFGTLSPAQQQALIRELQSQLPPAQRDAVIGMLMQPQGRPTAAAAGVQQADIDVSLLASQIAGGLVEDEDDETLGPGDTLAIEFELRDDPDAIVIVDEDRDRFRERLEDGNPYELDSAGRLSLPGVPAIALSGLNIAEATTRLRVTRALRPFALTLTHLPLAPVGTDALEPFGYDIFGSGPSMFSPSTDIPVPVDYVVGPFDTINIQLFGSENAEYFLEVGRDGNINFPGGIGPLFVSGLSFSDVRDLINERVEQQMLNVSASVTLGELRSITVFVLGDVVRAGSYTVSSLATMTNAIRLGGGISPIGSLRRIELNRGGETVTTLDLYDLLLRGDTSGDMRLQPGDVIFVPPIGATVAVDGEVIRPAIYELSGDEDVDAVIALAGGLRANANRSGIKLERIVPGRGISVSDLSLAAAAGGGTGVRDGDVLRVEPNLEQLEDSVRLAGNVQRAGLYQWYPGMTVSDLLPGPAVVRPLSDLRYVLIRRETTENVIVDALSVDIEAVWAARGGAADLALQPRDTVYVFHVETGRQQYVPQIIEELEAQARPNEPIQVARIGGQVRTQGVYPLEPGMRISDLLRAGGGLTDAAYAIDAELVRYQVVNGEYRETALIPIDLGAVIAGNSSADLALSPYDFLNVKEITNFRDQETVELRGEFRFPGEFPISRGERLSSAIERAGGLTEFAFPDGSIFTRVELREREMAQVQTLARRIESDLASLSLSDQGSSDALTTGQAILDQLRESQATGRLVIDLNALIAQTARGESPFDIVLQDGDQLFVPVLQQEVTVIGEVQYPTSHAFEAGLAREDYLDKSGGLTRRADDKRVYVVRANGEVVVDDGGRWFRRDVGIEIRPGDTIVAPLEVDRVRPLALWGSITQIMYNMAIAAAAVNSF